MGIIKHLRHTDIRDLDEIMHDIYQGTPYEDNFECDQFDEKEINYMIMRACIRARTDVAEEIVKLGEQNKLNMDLARVNQMAFHHSITNGNLWVTTWLYCRSKTCGKSVNLHQRNDEYFDIAIKRGHIHTANWLLEVCKYEKEPIEICRHAYPLLRYLTTGDRVHEKRDCLAYFLQLVKDSKFYLDTYIEDYPVPDSVADLFHVCCLLKK